MKFVDQAVIQVRSGAGGNGCVSFRREKYVPRGGPNGGDGGRGGHVILVASSQKDTLYHFHLNQHFPAKNGKHGQGKDRHGHNAPDLIVELPAGTTVKDAETGATLVDLARPGQKFMVAEGGRGGRGNARFATSTNRAPRRADPGAPGQELKLLLELSLLADVGLIGLPNVGKSTLLSRLSAARPKIADYPFTTLIPTLGVVTVGEEDTINIADIPGLIEGAAQGAGLGHRFLKHVQRCGVLLHMLDASQIDTSDPLTDYKKLNLELAAFSPKLATKEQFVAVNKLDLTGSDQSFKLVQEALPDVKVFGISALTGQGLEELKWALLTAVKSRKEVEADE
ncbi:MAG: GTPase ObgE [Deltaproteobacteria bacterium]|nr:GTPase ObgE [Deltaproteobacteria bacterium]MBW2052868.1 GTPase ObgE [Deltaproteobacteria bacterium]MBW2141255.1 GTPase ObgE [Deltaproteobacteria bacterium]